MAQTRDPIQPGLAHRSGAKRGTWYLRVAHGGRLVQLLLGGDDEMPVDVARDIVRDALADLDRGVMPDKEWVAWHRRIHADRIERPEPAPEDGPWTWRRAQREYLDDLLRRGRSHGTVDGYAKILRSLSELDGRVLADLTPDDFRQALAGIATDRSSTAYRGTEVARSVSRWLSTSGIVDDFLADLAPPPGAARSSPREERTAPTIDAIAETVSRCRSGSVAPSMARAIETVCLTGLSVRQVAAAQPDEVREGCWFVPSSARIPGFCLPLTPRLRTLLKGSEEWIFPEVATRDPDRLGPVTEVSVINALRRIGGTTPSSVRTTIAGALVDAGYSDREVEGLHSRVSADPVDEAIATALRGRMIRTWGEIIEARL